MRYRIPTSGRFETVVKKSRFICTVRCTDSVAAAKAVIGEVAAEFADASHNCWAYQIGPPDDTSRLGCSDDGEPKGTAGRPMLTVLTHADLGDVTVVVTRYFGGTKLGTGGLVKAYGDSVKEALAQVVCVDKVPRSGFTVLAPYSFVEGLKRGFAELEVAVTDEIYAAAVTFAGAVPDDRLTEFREWIESMYGVELKQ